MTRIFSNDTDAKRYVLHDNDEMLASVDYTSNGHAISFTRVFTHPDHRGKGLAADIMEYAVNEVEQTSDLPVLPMCSYAGVWFDKHPERAELLTRGVAAK